MTRFVSALLLSAGLVACTGGETPGTPPDDGDGDAADAPALEAGPGIDTEGQVIHIGTLNDESGPAATIGKPFADGKRLLAARANEEDGELLPDGWTVELVERDHGYNPTQAVAAYNEIKGDILFIGTSFGTPNTLPLRPLLEQDGIVAFPASLSSEMAQHTHTPPLGPSYKVEAMRAVDWIVANAEDPKLAIVYQKDDYGQDGLDGFTQSAEHHGVEVVAKQTVAPGQKDYAAVVTGLKEAGATHVMLSVLPSATGPILGTAAQLEYMPTWVGNTPAWIDGFFSPEVIPSQVFAKYYQMNGLPYWGEDVPGMDAFETAWEAHGGDLGKKDSYVLLSYIQGLVQLEAARRALDEGDITRTGYMTALRTIDGWDADGMIQPISLKEFPYRTADRTRVLQPDFENASWTVVADYTAPAALGGTAMQDEGGEAQGGE